MTVEPELIKTYVETGQAKLVFRPVLDHNPASQTATEIAYCAGAQDPAQFWAMHDLLFERQSEFWSNADKPALARQYAVELGLDDARFAVCMNAGEFSAQITAQDQERRAAGIRQRPSFRVVGPGQPEGRLIPGAQSFATFQELIAEAAGQ
jgi:protein-disulfide isomerase